MDSDIEMCLRLMVFIKNIDNLIFKRNLIHFIIDTQKKLFSNYCVKDENDSASKAKKAKADEKIQEIISFIQFANDECDYGMGLEFGLNMFSHGELALHKFIKVSTVNSYNLLGRELYSEILKEHLKNRKFNI